MSLDLKIPLSGMAAAEARLGAAASNIANAGSTAPVDAVSEVSRSGPVRPEREGVYQGYRPVRVEQTSRADGGTRARTRYVDPAYVRAYQPSHPDADDKGIVKRPNVSEEEELVELMKARRAYEANLRALKAEDEMLGTLIDSKA